MILDTDDTLTWKYTNDFSITAIRGTYDQVICNTTSGTTTISLPQSISPYSIPTFYGLNLSITLDCSVDFYEKKTIS